MNITQRNSSAISMAFGKIGSPVAFIYGELSMQKLSSYL